MDIYLILIFLFINALIVSKYDALAIKIDLYDKPDNVRKKHKYSTPAIGGIIIFFNIILFSIFANIVENEQLIYKIINLDQSNILKYLSFFLPVTLLFFLGFLDDKYTIKASIKFLLQTLIIIFAISLNSDLIIMNIFSQFLNFSIDSATSRFVFTLLCFLAFINAFNMFDGINLQSSTYALFLLIIIFFRDGYNEASIVLLLSVTTFIYLNKKNKCFLGDNGTLLLSFLISFLLVYNYNTKYIFRADEIFLMLLIPVIDLLRLFIIRTMNRNNVFRPDRNHLHHLLSNSYSELQVVVVINIMIFLPLMLFYLGIHSLICIFFSILTYSIAIYKSSKK